MSEIQFERCFKDDNTWESISEEEMWEILTINFKNSQAAMDLLLETGSLSTTFSLYRVKPEGKNVTPGRSTRVR
jgi:hypothetical protein